MVQSLYEAQRVYLGGVKERCLGFPTVTFKNKSTPEISDSKTNLLTFVVVNENKVMRAIKNAFILNAYICFVDATKTHITLIQVISPVIEKKFTFRKHKIF